MEASCDANCCSSLCSGGGVVLPGAANTPRRGTGLDARGTAGSTAILASTDRWTVVAGGVLQGEQGPAGRGSLDAYGRARRWRRKSSDTDAPPRSSPNAWRTFSHARAAFCLRTGRWCCRSRTVTVAFLQAWPGPRLVRRSGDTPTPGDGGVELLATSRARLMRTG